MEKVTYIPGRIESKATGNVVTGARNIIDDEKGKKQSVINSEVSAELVRLDQKKQDVLNFDNTPIEDSPNPVTSAGVFAADKALGDAIGAILLLIPSAASALNQLADKNFVNSSISTATATPRGTYNLVSDLDLTTDSTRETIAEKLGEVIDVADLNDYAFVQVPVSDDDPTEIERTERYKFNGNVWIYEYTLNTSGFTAAQWNAINSGITTALVEKLNGLPAGEALELALGAITQNIQNISAVIPTEATAQNQLADKAYVLTQILLATPSFKGQFTTLTQLEEVEEPKDGDLGIVRTKDTDGHDVITFYQYLDGHWNEYYVLSYHPQDKPATTGWLGDYPYNGMGRVELPMNMIEGWPDNTWIYLPKNDVVYLLYSWRLQLYAVYNTDTQEGLGLDDNLVVQPANYDIDDIEELVEGHYLPFTEDGGVWTITKPDGSTITSTELNNTSIYNYNDPTHLGINVLTQAMINRPNTIYVIQHDYDLNGATITVLSNCVLEFEGGSLSNGTIVGQNTAIDAGLIHIFKDGITVNGSWNISEVYPEWFGASCINTVDSTDAIEKAFSMSKCIVGSVIHSVNVVLSGLYYVSHTITMPPYIVLRGQNPRYTGFIAKDSFEGDFLLQTTESVTAPNSRQGFENIYIECKGKTSGIKIHGANELFICRLIAVAHYTTYGMYITELIRSDEPGRKTPTQNCLFEDLFIETPTSDESFGLYLDRCQDSLFIRVTVDCVNSTVTYRGTGYGIYGRDCKTNRFIGLNLEDCLKPIYFERDTYNISILGFLCKNPIFDLTPYNDGKIAVIRTNGISSLIVESYNFYANDVYKDIKGNVVDDADKYKRYDYYGGVKGNVSRGRVILPAKRVGDFSIKTGSFKISDSFNGITTPNEGVPFVDITLPNGGCFIGNSLLWNKDLDINTFNNLTTRKPFIVRDQFIARYSNPSSLTQKGQIGFLDKDAEEAALNQLCYHDGARILKLKGIPIACELGGTSDNQPSAAEGRFNYQQYFNTGSNMLTIWNNSRWEDAWGHRNIKRSGTTSERNGYLANMLPKDNGLMFFDTELGRPVFLKVTGTGTEQDPYVYSWVDATGATV